MTDKELIKEIFDRNLVMGRINNIMIEICDKNFDISIWAKLRDVYFQLGEEILALKPLALKLLDHENVEKIYELLKNQTDTMKKITNGTLN